jgi:penicillin-binding protein 1A
MDGTAPDGRGHARRPPRLWRLALAAFALAIVCAAGFAAWTIATLPPLPTGKPPGPPAVLLLTREGEPFARRGVRRDPPVDAASLPPYVAQAFVAIEDRRFYQHHGIDLQGMLRAAVADLKAGQVVQGGSTITQQLVKNTMFGPEQTFRRKLQEGIAALWLQHRLSKDQILSDYLNTVYFGDGAYGLAAASRVYFGKAPDRLSVSEAAMLAGLVKAPSELSPREHLKAARARERLVLQAMVEAGDLSAEQVARVRPGRPSRTGSPSSAAISPTGSIPRSPPRCSPSTARCGCAPPSKAPSSDGPRP